jgi:hypothetical protein
MKTARFITIASVLLVMPATARAQSGSAAYVAPAAEVEAVRRAALDYVEAIYEADPTRIERSVHPTLAKRGYYVNRDGAWQESPMTYDQLLQTARTWNASGKTLREGAPKQVTVLEVLDKTATAKIVAQWGIDYMHLAKYEDGWKIVNIVWQSHPR